MWPGRRNGAVWRAASSADADVTVENRTSDDAARDAEPSTSAAPLRRARSWICGPRSLECVAMSYAHRCSTPAPRSPWPIVKPASPKPMKPIRSVTVFTTKDTKDTKLSKVTKVHKGFVAFVDWRVAPSWSRLFVYVRHPELRQLVPQPVEIEPELAVAQSLA